MFFLTPINHNRTMYDYVKNLSSQYWTIKHYARGLIKNLKNVFELQKEKINNENIIKVVYINHFY